MAPPAPSSKPSSKKRKSKSQAAPAVKRARHERPPPTLVKSSTIVTVNVRRDDQEEYETFPIHKNYICHHSPYFEAAFNGRFIEGEKQEMDIDDVEPMAFGLFVTWLYSQTIIDEDGEIPHCEAIVKLWIFADKILCPRLQNQALTTLEASRVSSLSHRPNFNLALLSLVYDGTAPGSPLRRYLVDYCLNFNLTSPGIPGAKILPVELVIEMLEGTRRLLISRLSEEERYRDWKPSEADLLQYKVDETEVDDREGVSC